MWREKYFHTEKERDSWIENNSHKYMITILYVNNRFAVEYKDLKHFFS